MRRAHRQCGLLIPRSCAGCPLLSTLVGGVGKWRAERVRGVGGGEHGPVAASRGPSVASTRALWKAHLSKFDKSHSVVPNMTRTSLPPIDHQRTARRRWPSPPMQRQHSRSSLPHSRRRRRHLPLPRHRQRLVQSPTNPMYLRYPLPIFPLTCAEFGSLGKPGQFFPLACGQQRRWGCGTRKIFR